MYRSRLTHSAHGPKAWQWSRRQSNLLRGCSFCGPGLQVLFEDQLEFLTSGGRNFVMVGEDRMRQGCATLAISLGRHRRHNIANDRGRVLRVLDQHGDDLI